MSEIISKKLEKLGLNQVSFLIRALHHCINLEGSQENKGGGEATGREGLGREGFLAENFEFSFKIEFSIEFSCTGRIQAQRRGTV